MLGGGGGAPHWGEWCGALWNALPYVHVMCMWVHRNPSWGAPHVRGTATPHGCTVWCTIMMWGTAYSKGDN